MTAPFKGKGCAASARVAMIAPVIADVAAIMLSDNCNPLVPQARPACYVSDWNAARAETGTPP